MMYNYKCEELIQEVELECLCPLVEDLVDEYYKLHRYESYCLYTPAHIAEELIVRLITMEDECFCIDPEANVDLLSGTGNVLISVGDDASIYVESICWESGKVKVDPESKLVYISDELPSSVLKEVEKNQHSILVFGICEDEEPEEIDDEFEFDELECDGCCDECYDCLNDNYCTLEPKDDNEMPGFTVSQSNENGSCSFSFYSTDMDLVREMAEMFKK